MTFSISNQFKSPLNKTTSFSRHPWELILNPPEPPSPEVDEDSLFAGEVNIPVDTTPENFLSEQDARTTRTFVQTHYDWWTDTVRTQFTYKQEIEGTDLNDEITINPQTGRDDVDLTHYSIKVFGKGGNDTIINNHRTGVGHSQELFASGGEGIDTFKSIHRNSTMKILDMEEGEKFIVSLEHVYMGLDNRDGMMLISKHEGLRGSVHRVMVPDGFMLQGEVSEELNAMVYTMVAE